MSLLPSPPSDWLDVFAFSDLYSECQKHLHRHINSCEACVKRLAHAVTLYRGDFLKGLSIEDSEEFERWATTHRSRLHDQALTALTILSEYHLRRGTFELAADYARQQIALEPWREESHLQLMQALALSGRRSAALAQYEQCRRALREELNLDPAETTTRVRESILREQYELVEANVRAPLELPAEMTLIGRATELTRIQEQLENPACRLVTLIGIGGVGKTRLAIESARAQTGMFRDGIFFIDLAPLNSPSQILQTIAKKIGLSVEPNQVVKPILFAALRDKEMLVILDNLEHLLGGTNREDGAEIIAQLLDVAPQVVWLVTSRIALSCSAEWVMNVEGLAFPRRNENGWQHANTLAASEPDHSKFPAIELFAACARRANENFALNADTLPAVTSICQSLHGLPLGIELAALWTRAYPCQEIADLVESNPDLISGSASSFPIRHRSLHAVLEQSWRLLTKTEQSTLKRLTVLRNGFTPAAAYRILDAGKPVDLQSLVDKSLLRLNPTNEYEWHPFVQQFAREKLASVTAEANDAWKRAATYYVQTGDAATEEFDSTRAWREYTNALDCLTHLPQENEYWRLWVDVLLKEMRVGFFRSSPRVQIERLRHAEKILFAGQEIADRRRAAYICLWMGRAFRNLDENAEVLRQFERARGLAHEVNDSELLMLTAVALGEPIFARENCSESVRVLSETVMRLEKSGNVYEWLNAELGLANAFAYAGQIADAWQCIKRASDFVNSKQDARAVAHAHLSASLVAFHSGDIARAHAEAHECIRYGEEAEMGQIVAIALAYRAWCEIRMKEFTSARQALTRMDDILVREFEIRYADDVRKIIEAEFALNENRIDDALQFAAEAVRLSTRPENFYGSGMAHRVWAETLSRTSPPRMDDAEEHLKTSLAIFERGAALLEVARTRALWGKLARGRGMMAEAREQWSIAAQQFELSGAAVELKQIKSWHAQLPAKSAQTLKIGLQQ